MCSFGKPLTGAGGTKFYTGNKDDTPWNRDLLWKVFVDTEAEVQKKPTDKREGCIGIRRTHMGVTGTLIPESMYAVLLERQKQEQERAPRGDATARSGASGTRTARSGRSSARSSRITTARSSKRSQRTGRSSTGSAASQRTSRTVRNLKSTLVGEVRRRQQAENQIDKMREEMEAMRKEMNRLSKK